MTEPQTEPQAEALTEPQAEVQTEPPAELETEPLTEEDLLSVVGAYRLTAAVVAMTELSLPDHLASGPRTPEDLAAAAGVDPDLLGRLVRMLAAQGALLVDDQGRYANTGLSAALRVGPMRDMLLGWAALPGVVRAWSGLASGIRSGRSPFEVVNRSSFHDYLVANPAEAAAYDRAMGSTSQGFEDLAKTLELSGRETVVCVGGGNGMELGPLLDRYPGVRAILVDFPDTVPAAEAALAALGIRDRVEIAPGDARRAVPPGDTYVMSTVLRCLDDESARDVLRSCRRSAAPGATLHAFEIPLPEGRPQYPAAMMDLTAWVAYGGKDRTVSRWRELFAETGWRLEDVVIVTEPYGMLSCTSAEPPA
ncbi:MAG TPA: methyltransferase [Dermatophilaceae bacterium]|nr:methyltransferase [Dermatophilaceae bacterium]